MDKIQRLIQDTVRQMSEKSRAKSHVYITDINLVEHGVLIKFSNGRQQLINILQHAELYLLTSVILKRGRVEKIGREKILPLIWQRNRETNLVAFSIDKQGRLIGSIEQLTETADVNELCLYLERLAQECDQLEYLLTGKEKLQN